MLRTSVKCVSFSSFYTIIFSCVSTINVLHRNKLGGNLHLFRNYNIHHSLKLTIKYFSVLYLDILVNHKGQENTCPLPLANNVTPTKYESCCYVAHITQCITFQ